MTFLINFWPVLLAIALLFMFGCAFGAAVASVGEWQQPTGKVIPQYENQVDEVRR
jgi:hypothetical protein